MAGMASRLFGRGGGGQKGEIPRSPFGQRRCVLALPTEALGGGGGLGMAVDGELVVQQITDAAGPAAAAEVPVGWRIVGVDDRPVSSAVQLTAAIELATQPQPSGVGDDGALGSQTSGRSAKLVDDLRPSNRRLKRILSPTNKSGPFLVRWSPLLFQAAVLYTCGL